MSIVVIGSVFVDIKGYPISAYNPNGRNAGTMQTVHGGVARNVAEDIANVGFDTVFVSLLDNSGTAMGVEKRLQDRGIDTRYIRRTEDGMGTWLAIFANDHDVAAQISKRPDLLPLADTLDQSGDEIFANADSIALELDLERETVERIYALAEKHGKPVYAVVSNMTIALERREFLKKTACFVCNQEEAGQLFVEKYDGMTPAELQPVIASRVAEAKYPALVVTMGAQGAVWADMQGNSGFCPAQKVVVADTTGAGDAFFAGMCMGLTDGQTMQNSAVIGSKLAASVISTTENVCPCFHPDEFGMKGGK